MLGIYRNALFLLYKETATIFALFVGLIGL